MYASAQKVDAISGETIKASELALFLANDSIRTRYNNDAFDNIPVINLRGELPEVEGEILNPGINFIIQKQECLNKNIVSHKTVFFGLSRGFKGGQIFSGTPLSDILLESYNFSSEDIRSGLIAFGAKDAYRIVFSISELINRCDMEETLLVDAGDHENGRFIIRPGSDFFADRHLKGAKQGYILIE